jgi:serpin B
MAVANSLWAQDGAPLQPAFIDLVARRYGGSLNLLDFRHAGEAARETINQWVEEKTRQRIRELIPPGGLDAEARLVLVNAIYFKGMWELHFRRAATYDAPFHVEGGGTLQAPLMHQKEEIRYMQSAGYQALELVYRGGDLSMLILLPARNDGLRDLEETLSARMIHDCVARMSVCEVELSLPRFKVTWGPVNLREHFATLGMPLACTRYQADFSGMNGHEPPSEDSLFITAVFHKAFVEVNEEGTEAAAATAVLMARGAAPSFRADHPFVFAIRDRKSGAILFLGRISDPTQED